MKSIPVMRTHPIDISESARAKTRSEPEPEAIFASRMALATNCSLRASLPDRIQDLDTPDTARLKFFAATKKGPEGPVFLLYRIAMNSESYVWSGKRDSNSRPRPWQGRALPTELFPRLGAGHSTGIEECVKPLIQKVLFIWSRWSLNAARRLANIEPSTTTSALPQPAGVHNPPPPRS